MTDPRGRVTTAAAATIGSSSSSSASSGRHSAPTDANSDSSKQTNGGGSRKHYVRLVTEKRREQNRRAQKAYRERLRKKLAVLEEQTASAGSNAERDTPAVSTADVTLEEEKEGEGEGEEEVEYAPDLQYTATAARGNSHSDTRVINLADAFVAAGDLPFAQGSLPGLTLQVAPSPTPTPTPDHSALTEDGVEVDVANAEHCHADYGDVDLCRIWPIPVSPYSSKKQSHHHHYPLNEASHPYYHNMSTMKNTRASKKLMTFAPRGNLATNPNIQGLHFPFSSPKSTMGADPYANHLRVVTESNIEAFLAVGLSIGISRAAYLNDHPSHFPSCYVALNTPEPTSSFTTVKYGFSSTCLEITPRLRDHLGTVKAPLRPTPAQLLNPHPAYLDCIVFPYLRNAAVQASVDGILDHAELFMDIMHGGLVCWGGVSGLPNRLGRKGRANRGDMRQDVAWSTRSWEAKRWFLTKWTWLVGTEEDEEERGDVEGIWSGSRWWWAMRGEESEDEEAGAEGERLQGERVREVDAVGGPGCAGGHCL